MTKQWKKWLWSFTLVAVTLVLVSCGMDKTSSDTAENKGLNVVTSFYPMYDITKQISGELNDVRMINSGAGIHGFEPSAQDVAAITDSDLFVYHSGILEGWAKKLVASLDDQTAVIEGSKNQELKKVQGLEDIEVTEGFDESSLYDPHSWLDPVLIAEEAQAIAKKLGELDPDNADYYQANADEFEAEANKLVEEYQPKFEKLKQKTFVTQHTAFSYLADRFGLTQLGIAGIDSDIEPNPRQMTEVKNFIEDYDVKIIFVEPNVSESAARVLSTETGADIMMLSPLETDPENEQSYLENLKEQLDQLYTALAKQNS